MRIYSLDGELIKEITFPNKEYKENTKQNYDWHSLNKNPNRVPLRFLFRGFDVNSSGVFVGLYHDDLIIDQYDFDGNPVARYVKYHKDNRKHYLYSFKVVDDQKLYFYILFEDDYPQMGILTPDIKRQKM
jgi:hypothetical protein